jgi:hypothetical protein
MKALDNTEVVKVDLDGKFFTKHGQHMNAKGKELMAIKMVTAIKNILKIHRKSPISMKWKEDQNKENQSLEEDENIVGGGRESIKIHNVNVSLEINNGRLVEDGTTTKLSRRC